MAAPELADANRSVWFGDLVVCCSSAQEKENLHPHQRISRDGVLAATPSNPFVEETLGPQFLQQLQTVLSHLGAARIPHAQGKFLPDFQKGTPLASSRHRW
jgi:hypothetical protein